MDAWHRICAVGDVAENRPYAGTIAGVPVAVFRQDGRFFALHDLCSHAYARLSEGFLVRGAIECVLHNARFELDTGACVSIPRYDDVRTYELRVEDGEVLVRIDGDAGGQAPSAR